MMKTTLLASLVLLPSLIATAQPTAPTPPPPPPGPPTQVRQACSATGDVLFEIDHAVEDFAKGQLGTSELVLHEGGRWTFVSHTADGKLGPASSGCLSSTQMHDIRADLARATWKVHHADATCAALSAGYERYATRGKVVWTQKMCQLEILDEASAKALADIEAILNKVSAPQTPPCCKK